MRAQEEGAFTVEEEVGSRPRALEESSSRGLDLDYIRAHVCQVLHACGSE
jgi:hypothetical protein